MATQTKRRLLVVEDNLLNLEMLRDWLDLEGYEVFSAENLCDAQAAFLSEEPEMVLLDIRLGPEDGTDFALWVRSQDRLRDVPLIAVTAHALREERDRILQAGCNAVVSKPVEFKSLRAEMSRWWRR